VWAKGEPPDLGSGIFSRIRCTYAIYFMNEKQILEEMIALGLTIKQIGEKIEKNESSVRRLLKKHQLKTYRFIDRDVSAKNKKCRYCYKNKPIDEFPIVSKNGIDYTRCKCDTCYYEMKLNRRRSSAKWLEEFKKKLQCKNCENSDFRVLEFHHLSDKLFNIADGASRGFSKEKIMKEISKCEVLCSNCHKIETYERRSDTGSDLTFIE
jgi:predicted transcriptional regulator